MNKIIDKVSVQGKDIKNKVITTWKNHTKKVIAGIAVLILILVIIFGGSSNTEEGRLVVGRSDVIDEVSLSGRTEAVNSVDLGFYLMKDHL